MSRKRHKKHKPTRQQPRTTSSVKSLSTMGDAMPAEFLTKLKEQFSKRSSDRPQQTTPQNSPVQKQELRPAPSATIPTKVAATAKSTKTLTIPAQSNRQTPSSRLRIPKSDSSKVDESFGLAQISAKTVRKPGRTLRTKKKQTSAPIDWRSVLNSDESKKRRNEYAQLILKSLGQLQRDPIDINLGIDLGTSFSKVVWRGPDKAYPICFGDNPANLDQYLVPSIVVLDEDSIQTSLTPKARINSDGSIPNFKMCLACVSEPAQECQPTNCTLSNWWRAINSLPEPVELVNATFLAHLIYRSKNLVRAHLKKLGVKDSAIRWSANLAVPEKYMDVSLTLASFKRVLRIAWLMSEVLGQLGEIKKTHEVTDLYVSAKKIAESGESFDCFVYPEVAAEVASVTKPRSAKQGLYAFVDVGAGTVDGSVFRFYRPLKDDPSQFTYAASVIKAGAVHVELNAGEKLAEVARDWFKTMKENGGKKAGLSLTPEMILDPPFDQSLKGLEIEVRDELIQLFKAAHEKEPGEFKWRDLQLIIGGGGASLPAYTNAAREAFTLKGNHRGGNLTHLSLDSPSDFEMGPLSRNAFHRFAVAYGLSFHHVNLPQVVLAKEVDPAGPGRVREPIEDPTKDD